MLSRKTTARICALALWLTICCCAAAYAVKGLWRGYSAKSMLNQVAAKCEAVWISDTDIFSLSFDEQEQLGRFTPQALREAMGNGAATWGMRISLPVVSYNLQPVDVDMYDVQGMRRDFFLDTLVVPRMKLLAVSDPERLDDFAAGRRRVVQGAMLAPGDMDRCLISEEFAEKNGLSVDSMVSLMYYDKWTIPFYFRVAGIYRDETEPFDVYGYAAPYFLRRNEIIVTSASVEALYYARLDGGLAAPVAISVVYERNEDTEDAFLSALELPLLAETGKPERQIQMLEEPVHTYIRRGWSMLAAGVTGLGAALFLARRYDPAAEERFFFLRYGADEKRVSAALRKALRPVLIIAALAACAADAAITRLPVNIEAPLRTMGEFLLPEMLRFVQSGWMNEIRIPIWTELVCCALTGSCYAALAAVVCAPRREEKC